MSGAAAGSASEVRLPCAPLLLFSPRLAAPPLLRRAAATCPAPAPSPRTQEYVFIKRVADGEDECYAELSILLGDTVARLAKRACAEFPRWGAADAGQVSLYLVPNDACSGDEPSEKAEADALGGARLQSGKTLAGASIAPRSWLLARISLPAAAAGALCFGGASPLFPAAACTRSPPPPSPFP